MMLLVFIVIAFIIVYSVTNGQLSFLWTLALSFLLVGIVWGGLKRILPIALLSFIGL